MVVNHILSEKRFETQVRPGRLRRIIRYLHVLLCRPIFVGKTETFQEGQNLFLSHPWVESSDLPRGQFGVLDPTCQETESEFLSFLFHAKSEKQTEGGDSGTKTASDQRASGYLSAMSESPRSKPDASTDDKGSGRLGISITLIGSTSGEATIVASLRPENSARITLCSARSVSQCAALVLSSTRSTDLSLFLEPTT